MPGRLRARGLCLCRLLTCWR